MNIDNIQKALKIFNEKIQLFDIRAKIKNDNNYTKIYPIIKFSNKNKIQINNGIVYIYPKIKCFENKSYSNIEIFQSNINKRYIICAYYQKSMFTNINSNLYNLFLKFKDSKITIKEFCEIQNIDFENFYNYNSYEWKPKYDEILSEKYFPTFFDCSNYIIVW